MARRLPCPVAPGADALLLLLPQHRRVVIELDGLQHHADDNGRAELVRYAQLAAGDHELRLAGYEVYRFGGHEIADRRSRPASMTWCPSLTLSVRT